MAKRVTMKRTAQSMYDTQARNNRRLIQMLQTHLRQHANRAAARPTNWHDACAVSVVCGHLIDAVASITGQARDAVKRSLLA